MYNSILKFANLFIKLANEAYEEYKNKVELLSKSNPYPFSHWFDSSNGRVYLPFKTTEESSSSSSNEDKWVYNLLKDYGWVITDYRGGYAQKNGRTMRIGKIFSLIRKESQTKWTQALQEAQQRNADEFEIENIKRKTEQETKFINETEKDFTTSPFRSKKGGGLLIVISQNPHDVATMSTGRSWESCMTLGPIPGSHHQDVYCEVKDGGLIAYLIDDDDVEINHPHARVHIRRFDSGDNSIAIPEKSVYGNNVPGFLDSVNNWINTMQQNITPGIYERRGGKYSDSFSSTYVVAPEVKIDTPSGQAELAKWLDGTGLPENTIYTKYNVIDNLYEMGGFDEYNDYEDYHSPVKNRSAVFLSKEEAEHYIQEQNQLEETDTEREFHAPDSEWNDFDEEKGDYNLDRFSIKENIVDNTSDLKARAAEKLMMASKESLLPDVLIKLKNYFFNDDGKWSQLKNDFIKKYPELLTIDEINELSDSDQLNYIKSLPPEKRIPYINSWNESINKTLISPNDILTDEIKEKLQDTKETIIPGYSKKTSAETDIEILFAKYIKDPISEIFDKIPEETIQNLISFINKLSEYGMDESGRSLNRMHGTLMHLFSLKEADSPAVQEYYKSQLFRIKNDILSGTELLWVIGRLGENGKNFIPFLKEVLEDTKQKYLEQRTDSYREKDTKKYLRKRIESILWAIDSIENKTGHSKKYQFNH